MNATKGQIRKIHVLKSALGLDDSEYRGILSTYGARSSTELPYRRASDLIERFECAAVQAGKWTARTEHTPRRFDHLADRPGKASPAQLRMVEAAWVRVSNQPSLQAKRKALNVWLGKHFGISAIEWLNGYHVSKVMRAIGAMSNQKRESLKCR